MSRIVAIFYVEVACMLGVSFKSMQHNTIFANFTLLCNVIVAEEPVFYKENPCAINCILEVWFSDYQEH